MGLFLQLLHREPVVVWSCLIGAVGLALPIVVPPIKESMFPTEIPPPPGPRQVAAAMVAKS